MKKFKKIPDLQYPYAIVSDIHFHSWTFGSYTNPEGVNSRLQIIIDEFERMAGELKASGGKHIVITGDLFHTRGEIKPSVFNPVHQMFERLCDDGFIIFAIPGNHDLEGEEAEENGNCFHSLRAIKNFHIFYAMSTVGITDPSGKWMRERAIFIPWTDIFLSKLELVVSASDATSWAETRTTVFAHVGLSDVVTGIHSALGPEQFHKVKGLRYAFCGHFHNHKRFDIDDGFAQSSVFSVGASTHQSFKDIGSTAGFIIVHSPENVQHYQSQAPEFVEYDEYDFLHPEKLQPHKFYNNYVRVNVEVSFSKEEAVMVKTTLEGIGALKVINITNVSEDTSMVTRENKDSPITFVFSDHKSKGLSNQIAEYIKSRYEGEMSKAMIDILGKDDFDEC